MAQGLDIRRRIKSIKSTRAITKAMQMVAASKMRKAQEQALRTRSYAQKALEILATLSEKVENYNHYLLRKTEGTRYLMLLVTSNKGLCGSLNANSIRKTVEFIEGEKAENAIFDFVTLGKKGRDALMRLRKNIKADFSDIGESLSFLDIAPLTKTVLDAYKEGKYDRVYVVYTHFVSVLSQKPVVKRVVPLGKDIIESLNDILKKNDRLPIESRPYEYIFEPTPQVVLDALLPKFVEIQIYQAILESYASEQSARMMAMKNATEAAGDIMEDLTLSYNKMRQAGITQEISEIVGGSEALKKSS